MRRNPTGEEKGTMNAIELLKPGPRRTEKEIVLEGYEEHHAVDTLDCDGLMRS